MSPEELRLAAMSEMRMVAMAYYANMSQDQKVYVSNFYRALDVDRDGKVTVQEFIAFFKKAGCIQNLPPNMFQLVDINNDGTLDFEECVTFFYMNASRRLVYCDGCRLYLFGAYFLCVECYYTSEVRGANTYDLCCACYRDKKFNHVHSTFLDNHTLLRHKALDQDSVDSLTKCSASTKAVIQASEISKPAGASKLEKIKEAAESFDTGFQIGTTAATVAAAVCTIM